MQRADTWSVSCGTGARGPSETLFGGRYLTVVGFYPKVGTVYTPEILAKVSRVTDALETIPGIKQGALLSLTSKNLKDVRVTEDSIEVAPFISELPTTPDQVARFKNKVQQSQALTSLLVSQDGRATTKTSSPQNQSFTKPLVARAER